MSVPIARLCRECSLIDFHDSFLDFDDLSTSEAVRVWSDPNKVPGLSDRCSLCRMMHVLFESKMTISKKFADRWTAHHGEKFVTITRQYKSNILAVYAKGTFSRFSVRLGRILVVTKPLVDQETYRDEKLCPEGLVKATINVEFFRSVLSDCEKDENLRAQRSQDRDNGLSTGERVPFKLPLSLRSSGRKFKSSETVLQKCAIALAQVTNAILRKENAVLKKENAALKKKNSILRIETATLEEDAISRKRNNLIERQEELIPPNEGTIPESENIYGQPVEQTPAGGDSSAMAGEGPFNMLLVDVKRLCVTAATSNQRYLALSYVAAGYPIFRTKKATQDTVCAEGGLLHVKDDIPAVFWDAVWLTRELGEDYLWIDALCIIDDDPKHKHPQIDHMADIYGQAVLAIVALCGSDPSSGLAGSISRPRKLEPVHVHEALLCPLAPSIDDVLEESRYEDRGWCMQERLLSPRCLYVTPLQTYFQSTHTILHETGYDEGYPWEDRPAYNILQGPNNPELSISYDSEVFFSDYAQLVERYTKRELSEPSDRLRAFSGVMGALTSQHGVSFLCGLPEVVFEAALLWRAGPASVFGESFRDTRLLTIDCGKQVHLAPTWSWACRDFQQMGHDIVYMFGSSNRASITSPYVVQEPGKPIRPISSIENRWHGEKFTAEFCAALQETDLLSNHDVPLLYFWAETFGLQEENEGLGIMTGYGEDGLDLLADSQGRLCGTILDYWRFPSTRPEGNDSLVWNSANWEEDDDGVALQQYINAHPAFQFVGLCRSLRGYGDTKEWDPPYGQEGGESEIVFALLIRRYGNVAERQALCSIHPDAWEAVEKTGRLIALR